MYLGVGLGPFSQSLLILPALQSQPENDLSITPMNSTN